MVICLVILVKWYKFFKFLFFLLKVGDNIILLLYRIMKINWEMIVDMKVFNEVVLYIKILL